MITPYPEENSISPSPFTTHRSDFGPMDRGVRYSGTGWGYLQKIHIADMICQYFSVKIRPYPVFIGYLHFSSLYNTHRCSAPVSRLGRCAVQRRHDAVAQKVHRQVMISTYFFGRISLCPRSQRILPFLPLLYNTHAESPGLTAGALCCHLWGKRFPQAFCLLVMRPGRWPPVLPPAGSSSASGRRRRPACPPADGCPRTG